MYSVLELSCICTAVIIQQLEILLSHQKKSNLQFPVELQIAILNLHLRKHFAHRKIKTEVIFFLYSAAVFVIEQ